MIDNDVFRVAFLVFQIVVIYLLIQVGKEHGEF